MKKVEKNIEETGAKKAEETKKVKIIKLKEIFEEKFP